MTTTIYSTMTIITCIILVAILLESIRVLMRSFRRKLFLGQASLKVDVLPVTVEKERRRHAKVNITWPVILDFNGEKISATAKDISLGGAFVACQEPLPLQEQLKISVNVPRERPLTLNAEVVWSNSSVPEDRVVTRGMGIKFMNNSMSDIDCLKDMIADCLHRAEAEHWVDAETKTLQDEAPSGAADPEAAQGPAVPARA